MDPAALTPWAAFPAHAQPRPMVIESLPRVPDAGFTDGDGKGAVLDGRFELAAALPPAPPPTLPVDLPEAPRGSCR